VNWKIILRAKIIKKAAIKYLTYIPKPLIEVSKFNIGLLMRLDFPHIPRAKISQHNGRPKKTIPIVFKIDFVFLWKPA
jgi:hypothetical protein